MSRRREHGVVLVAAVTALALMSVLALGLAETTVLDERLAEKSLAALQADALARSGVAVAAVVLAETGAAGAPDTLGAPWAVDVGRQPLGPGWVEVQVEDEARRLDLNAPELADAVPRLLALLGLEPGLADANSDAPVQFERQGYFCVDPVDTQPGRPVWNRTVTLKDTWAQIERRQAG